MMEPESQMIQLKIANYATWNLNHDRIQQRFSEGKNASDVLIGCPLFAIQLMRFSVPLARLPSAPGWAVLNPSYPYRGRGVGKGKMG